MSEYRTMIFVLGVLYYLPEKWRGIRFSQSFHDILKGRRGVNLNLAWFMLKKEKLLGEFGGYFYYDSLYGMSNLNEIMNCAYDYLLVRKDGTNFAYHLDAVSQKVINRFLQEQKIEIETIQVTAYFLSRLLDKQADTAESSNYNV